MQVKRGKTEYTPGSGSVDVKAGKSENHRPFFFVRLRIDGQELCGPRHDTEEAGPTIRRGHAKEEAEEEEEARKRQGGIWLCVCEEKAVGVEEWQLEKAQSSWQTFFPSPAAN